MHSFLSTIAFIGANKKLTKFLCISRQKVCRFFTLKVKLRLYKLLFNIFSNVLTFLSNEVLKYLNGSYLEITKDVSNLRIELKDGSNKSNDQPFKIMVQDINS